MELLKSITVSVALWDSLQAERACKNVTIKVTQVHTEEPHNKSFKLTLAWEITLHAQATAWGSLVDALKLATTHTGLGRNIFQSHFADRLYNRHAKLERYHFLLCSDVHYDVNFCTSQAAAFVHGSNKYVYYYAHILLTPSHVLRCKKRIYI
jgi:hypothetical protein